MKSSGSREKRKADRIRVPLEAKFRLKGSRVFLKDPVCLEISGRGIHISVSCPLEKGELTEVAILPKDSNKAINALCRVRWCKKSAKDGFHAGMEFVKIKNPVYFEEFMCEKIAETFLVK